MDKTRQWALEQIIAVLDELFPEHDGPMSSGEQIELLHALVDVVVRARLAGLSGRPD